MSKKMKRILTLAACVILLAAVLIVGKAVFPERTPETEDDTVMETPTGLIINEVVASSRYSLLTETGAAPDWIELYNGSGSAISLSGLSLSDDPKTPEKFPLPAVSVKAGGYLVILCDGKEDAKDDYVHAGFRLSAKGDFIGLYSGGSEIHSLEIPALGKDISYGRAADGHYRYLAVTTPGGENSNAASDTPDFANLSGTLMPEGLAINEYQMKNTTTLMDCDGEHSAWVELKNLSAEAIQLADYALSDHMDNAGKWSLPEGELAPGATKIVILSGKDLAENELHANFRLGAEDTCLVLTRKGYGVADMLTLDHTLPENCSYGRTSAGEWAYFAAPTPGMENTTKSFKRLDISEEKYLPDV